MKQSLSEQLQVCRTTAWRNRNAAEVFYYQELSTKVGLAAFTKFEVFIKTDAGQKWAKKRRKEIIEFAESQKKRTVLTWIAGI